MLRSRIAVLAAVVMALAAPSTAGAVTHSMDFDATPSGTVVSSGPGGLTMPQNPVVFNASGKTQSSPNGLRRAGDCPNSEHVCTTGNHRIEFVFDAAHKARSVTLRTGTVVPFSCFELDCPTVQLVGFDAANNVVAAEPKQTVTAGQLTHELSIDAFAYSIKKAVLVFSGDPLTGAHQTGDGHQYTAQLDNLSYDVFEDDPPPPEPPPAPDVEITSPDGSELFANTDITVEGTASAPAGAANFCVIANAGPSFPSDCHRVGQIRGDGTFSVFRIPGMRPGANEVRVWIRDSIGRTDSDVVSVQVVNGEVDFITETIEITQAVQTEELPRGLIQPPGVAGGALVGNVYDGVPLARVKPTIVRVYGAARGAPTPVTGATAILRGFRPDGSGGFTELAGSPLRPHASPATLQADPSVAALRASEEGSYNFILPVAWTNSARALHLVATVEPAGGGTDCCPFNNSFLLSEIPFSPTRTLTAYPVPTRWTGTDGVERTVPDPPASYFNEARAVFPGPSQVFATFSPIDVSDIVNRELAKEEPDGFVIVDGVIARLDELYGDLSLRGKMLGLIPGIGSGKGPGKIGATGAIQSKLDFMAHELGHQWGLAHGHRDDGCVDDDEDGAFDGPVSKRAPLLGVGLDPRMWSGSGVGRFKTVAPERPGVYDAEPDAPDQVYDFMSYCSNEGQGRTWVSTPYWANQVRELRPGGQINLGFEGRCCFLGGASDPTVRPRRGLTGPGPLLHVNAALRLAGPPHQLFRVEAGFGRADLGAAGEGPPVHVIVKRADGSVISDSEVYPELEAGRGGDADDDLHGTLDLSVPSAADADSVEIASGGVTLLEREASPTPPSVRLVAPAKGTRISSKGGFVVRWQASDADGDPLVTRVEFSSDGGQSWRGLAAGVFGNRARIRGAALPRTDRGILRVVTSDGFHVGRSAVRPIITEGTPPRAVITAPDRASIPVLRDTNLTLTGYGHDDAGRPIVGRKLVWRSGGRRIGSGPTASAPVRRLGRSVKLTATGADGRRGSDTLRLRVLDVAPVFTTLRTGPLGGSASRLKLFAASSLPGTLRVTGKGVRTLEAPIGTKARRYALRLTRRRGSYSLRVVLRAGGERSVRTMLVDRN